MRGFQPSLLEKLFDDEPHNAAQGTFKRLSLEQFKASVAADIEALLNSRFSVEEELLSVYVESAESLITYGLPDLSNRSLASSIDRSAICKSLSDSIARHESRLKEVSVTLDQRRHSIGGLRFTIRATLMVYPAIEPVSFDATLQPGTLHYRVS
jgi:type VI secretion system protein ImpF